MAFSLEQKQKFKDFRPDLDLYIPDTDPLHISNSPVNFWETLMRICKIPCTNDYKNLKKKRTVFHADPDHYIMDTDPVVKN
jgi:hypothetical protein